MENKYIYKIIEEERDLTYAESLLGQTICQLLSYILSPHSNFKNFMSLSPLYRSGAQNQKISKVYKKKNRIKWQN